MAFRGAVLILAAGMVISPRTQPLQMSSGAAVLLPGAAVNGDAGPGQPRTYGFSSAAGDFALVSIEPVRGEVQAELQASDGTRLAAARGGNLPYFSLAAVVTVSGTCTVTVRSTSKVAARYSIRLRGVRAAGAAERGAAEAWRAVSEGTALVEENRSLMTRPPEPLERALQKFAEAEGGFRAAGDGLGEAAALFSTGQAHWFLRDFSAAADFFRRARGVWRSLGHPFAGAGVGVWIAAADRDLGRYEECMAELEAILAAQRAAGDESGVSDTLRELADTYGKMLDPQRQIAALQEALAVDRRIQGGFETMLMNRIGTAYARLRDFTTAMDYYRRVLAMLRARGKPTGAQLSLMAGVMESLGDHESALALYLQAAEKRPPEASPALRAGDYSAAAEIYSGWGDWREALAYAKRALDAYAGLRHPRFEAMALIQTGTILARSGQVPEALEELRKAQAKWPESPSQSTAGFQARLGWGYETAGDQKKALECYRQALALRRPFGNTGEQAALLGASARMEAGLGRTGKALSDIEQAIGIEESLRTHIYSPDQRASYFSGVRQLYETQAGLLMRLGRGNPGQSYEARAFEASERSRARNLLESLAQAGVDIREGADAGLLISEKEAMRRLSAQEGYHSQLLARRHTASEERASQGTMARLRTELDQIQAQLRRENPRYAALTAPDPLSLGEVQRMLDSGTLLLEYFLGGERSFLYAVTGNGLASFELPPRHRIEAEARRFHKLVSTRSAEAEVARAAKRLSRMILAPALELLRNRRLVIAGDGALEYVPFGALPDPTDGQVLLARHEVSRMPSASVLAAIRRTASERKAVAQRVAILADPVFDGRDERVRGAVTAEEAPGGEELRRSLSDTGVTERGRIPRLPFSRREANAISRLLPAGAAYTALDFRANREAARGPEMAEARIVHFATHGLLNSRDPSMSGIVLSLVDAGGKPQNGFLRLHEIYNLKLRADLVVLSACQTALGREVRGEGLMSLTRGFFHAGAVRVAASLWKVNDASTASLMAEFYRGMLVERMPAAAALRRAQLAIRATPRWRAAYYWAPFELQGEWR